MTGRNTNPLSLRAQLYRAFQKSFIRKWVVPLLTNRDVWSRIPDVESFRALSPTSATKPRIWFHAASAGELQIVWPLVSRWLKDASHEAVVTIFSSSAEKSLAQLQTELTGKPGTLLFAGFSPWEGDWSGALALIRPHLFVSAKYEAWPELWMSLREREIPLAVICAKSRRSLTVARQVARWATGLPKMILLTESQSDADSLKVEFPDAELVATGDPRWDQVLDRAERGNSRAKALLTHFGDSKRPWGVLGSVWPEDLPILEAAFDRTSSLAGTVWIAPHRIDPVSIEKICAWLDHRGVPYARTSEVQFGTSSDSERPQVILVDEMGILLELYSGADWVYVGGGFARGVHSTMEPSVFGTPISCGSKSVSHFPEIEQLRQCGQLTVVNGRDEFARWLAQASSQRFRKEEWIRLSHSRAGASDRVMKRFNELLAPC